MATLSQLLQQVNASLATDGLHLAIGAKEAARSSSTPRLVWIPLRFRGGPPSRTGGYPRPLWSLYWVVEVRAWADDFTGAEALLEQALQALYAQAVAHELQDGDCPTNEDPRAQDNGEVIRARVEIEVLCTDVTPTTVEADEAEFDTTDAVSNDGVLHAGES